MVVLSDLRLLGSSSSYLSCDIPGGARQWLAPCVQPVRIIPGELAQLINARRCGSRRARRLCYLVPTSACCGIVIDVCCCAWLDFPSSMFRSPSASSRTVLRPRVRAVLAWPYCRPASHTRLGGLLFPARRYSNGTPILRHPSRWPSRSYSLLARLAEPPVPFWPGIKAPLQLHLPPLLPPHCARPPTCAHY